MTFGPADGTTIPGVVIETPPAMGTAKSVTVDLHLVRRAMQDDGTGQFSGIKGHLGQVLGWSFEAINLKLFLGVTHVQIEIYLVEDTVFLWSRQPWFGNDLGELGTLEAIPADHPDFLGPRDHPALNIRQRCFLIACQGSILNSVGIAPGLATLSS